MLTRSLACARVNKLSLLPDSPGSEAGPRPGLSTKRTSLEKAATGFRETWPLK